MINGLKIGSEIVVRMNNAGQVFTIDALLALIIITLIIGLSANAMNIAGNKLQDYASEQAQQRIVENAADALIKTSGSPENWEDKIDFPGLTPGLAESENRTKRIGGNTLSIKKIFRLRNNPELMKKLLPSTMTYSLIIYPIDTSLPSIVVQNKTPSNDVADVSVVNRTVEYDYMLMDLYLSIETDKNEKASSEYVCTHSNMGFLTHMRPDLDEGKPGWLCQPFNINLDTIKSKDFYLLTDPPFLNDNSILPNRWIIDTPDMINESSHKFTSSPILVTPIISELSGNKTTQTFVLHIFNNCESGKTFKTYLVGVPKGTPSSEVRLDRINPQPAFFILKIWFN
jgi:hypothetical protein